MRRALAGLITRFTFWLDMTAAIKLPGAINHLAARIDNFTERHIWDVDKTLLIDRWINGGAVVFGDWQVGRPQDMPKPIPFTPEELYGPRPPTPENIKQDMYDALRQMRPGED